MFSGRAALSRVWPFLGHIPKSKEGPRGPHHLHSSRITLPVTLTGTLVDSFPESISPALALATPETRPPDPAAPRRECWKAELASCGAPCSVSRERWNSPYASTGFSLYFLDPKCPAIQESLEAQRRRRAGCGDRDYAQEAHWEKHQERGRAGAGLGRGRGRTTGAASREGGAFQGLFLG